VNGRHRLISNAMSVDVEDYFHVAALSKVIHRDDWSRMEYRAEESTRRLLDIFSENDVKATFFVLGWIAQRSPSLVREIHAAGHEVACHGLSHKLIFEQSKAEFKRESRESKSMLEDLIGSAVTGYRAASWSITRQSLWALDVLLDLDFKYDSSIFPIHHDLYGIPNAPTLPSIIGTPEGRQIAEFPPSTARFFGLRVPVAGGGYFRLLPYWVTEAGLRQINESSMSPFAFYLHPWEIDVGQPDIKAGAISHFRHYTNIDKCEGRLRRLLQIFSFSPMGSVLQGLALAQPA
jgi:polysaccharide deacetylase family protein (PEP-CTERM system associated)